MTPASVNEYFFAYQVEPGLLDDLLEQGWRHFGVYFYRYSQDNYGGQRRNVRPVRVRLADFCRSKRQRRVWRDNADLSCVIRPAEIDDAKIALFERHKLRFTHNIPESLYDFLSHTPATIPVDCRECCLYAGDRLLAVSFFDVGAASVSAIYAMFEPAEAARSLGLYTMLREIEFAQTEGKNYYYHGYCHETSSFYDYKKRFSGLEYFIWDAAEWCSWRDSSSF
jgi:arginine-tRNA-protein transferase